MIRTPGVSMDFKKITIADKIVFGNNVVVALAANVPTFAVPDVPLATLTALTTTLSNAAQAAAGGDHQKIATMHAAEKTWETTFGTEAKYVDRIANGTQATILLAGFVATSSQTTIAAVPAIAHISKGVANATMPGSIHVEVDFDATAKNYLCIVSSTNAPIVLNGNQFILANNPTVIAFISDSHRKFDFSGLPSRADVFVSVVAQNSTGSAAPSSPLSLRTL